MTIRQEVADALAAQVVHLVLLCELEFASGPARFWTGLGDFTWGDRTFEGVGLLGGISEITGTAELRATGYTLTLSGVGADGAVLDPTGKLRDIITVITDPAERWQNRPARFWLAVLDEAGTLIGTIGIDSARMDQMLWEEGETATISLTIETEAVQITRAAVRRYTAEDQRGEWPGDAAFDAVASLQNRTVRWGVANDPA